MRSCVTYSGIGSDQGTTLERRQRQHLASQVVLSQVDRESSSLRVRRIREGYGRFPCCATFGQPHLRCEQPCCGILQRVGSRAVSLAQDGRGRQASASSGRRVSGGVLNATNVHGDCLGARRQGLVQRLQLDVIDGYGSPPVTTPCAPSCRRTQCGWLIGVQGQLTLHCRQKHVRGGIDSSWKHDHWGVEDVRGSRTWLADQRPCPGCQVRPYDRRGRR